MKISKWIWVLGGTATLVALFSAFSFVSVSYDENKQSQNVHGFFFNGIVGARDGKSVVESCSDRQDHRWIFCSEGYYYGISIRDFTDPKLNAQQIYQLHRKEFQKLPPTHTNLWAIPFGMAIPYTNRDQKEINAFLKNHSIRYYKYYIDGWALSSSHRLGLKKTIEVCEQNFGPEYVNICWWGAGRAEFLYRPAEEAPAGSNKFHRGGFHFARNFTRLHRFSYDEIEKIDFFPRKAAESVKNMLMDYTNIPPGPFTEFLSCMFEKHLIECEEHLEKPTDSTLAKQARTF